MAQASPVLLVGCGTMGGALLESWRAGGADVGDVLAVEPEPERAREMQTRHGIRVATGADDLPTDFSPAVVVFAVKPQVIAGVAPRYARFVAAGALALSVVAGTTIAFFEGIFGSRCGIVRTMPNTPAAVGRGITVLVANSRTSESQRQAAERLLAAVGETLWLDDENLLDAVTAVSGGGPGPMSSS